MSQSPQSERAGASSVGLLVFMLACSVALWLGRQTPAAPPAGEDEEHEAVFQRTLAWVQRDGARWQEEHGDRTLSWEDAKGHLVIVIDDVGRELDAHAALQALAYPLTFSILPGSVYAAGAQLRLREDERRYREIWLHLPMEPRDASVMRSGLEVQESFLTREDSDEALRSKTIAALERVPAAVGVNNHMGSAFTTDERGMRIVLETLREQGKLFMDSRTHHETVGARIAGEIGLAHAERRVFLDHDPDPAAMALALEEAIELSKRQPTVAIGHPSRALAAVLEEGLDKAYEGGVAVFPLSEHIARVEAARSGSKVNDRAGIEQSDSAP